jgi:hypothetical protein
MSIVAESWYIHNLARLELDISVVKNPPTQKLINAGNEVVSECFADSTKCQVGVYASSHEGDDPDDTELYFTVVRGIFPTNATEGVVRVFFVDIARFGKAKNGGPAEVQKIVPLFLDEKPLTDEAWTVNPAYPDIEEPLKPEFRDLKVKNLDGTYTIVELPETLKALTNFMYDHVDDPLGLRLTEFVGFRKTDGQISVINTETNVYHVVELDGEPEVVGLDAPGAVHDEN